jgi:outer membrane protein
MNTHRKSLLACLLGASLLGAVVFDASAQSVGFVDMERVLQESDAGKAAQAKLAEQFGDEQQAFGQREQEIRQLQAALERDKPLMSKAQVQKKEEDIKARVEQFEKDFSEIQRAVMKAQQEEGQKVLAPARTAVNSVAEKKKLAAVFEASQAGLLYLGDSADITEEVINALNAQ